MAFSQTNPVYFLIHFISGVFYMIRRRIFTCNFGAQKITFNLPVLPRNIIQFYPFSSCVHQCSYLWQMIERIQRGTPSIICHWDRNWGGALQGFTF